MPTTLTPKQLVNFLTACYGFVENTVIFYAYTDYINIDDNTAVLTDCNDDENIKISLENATLEGSELTVYLVDEGKFESFTSLTPVRPEQHAEYLADMNYVHNSTVYDTSHFENNKLVD